MLAGQQRNYHPKRLAHRNIWIKHFFLSGTYFLVLLCNYLYCNFFIVDVDKITIGLSTVSSSIYDVIRKVSIHLVDQSNFVVQMLQTWTWRYHTLYNNIIYITSFARKFHGQYYPSWACCYNQESKEYSHKMHISININNTRSELMWRTISYNILKYV